MLERIMFTAPHNSVYEGVRFNNGIAIVTDPRKIKKLRNSFHYGTLIQEVEVTDKNDLTVVSKNVQGAKPLDKMKLDELRDKAREMGLEFTPEFTRQKLIDLISEA